MCEVFEEIKNEGQIEGQRKNVLKQVYKKYQKKGKWINQCTSKQLDNFTYKQFKEEVLKE